MGLTVGASSSGVSRARSVAPSLLCDSASSIAFAAPVPLHSLDRKLTTETAELAALMNEASILDETLCSLRHAFCLADDVKTFVETTHKTQTAAELFASSRQHDCDETRKVLSSTRE